MLGLPGNSFYQPNITGGHNVSERDISAVRGWSGCLNLLGPFIYTAVPSVQREVEERASSVRKGGEEKTLAICRPGESRQLVQTC